MAGAGCRARTPTGPEKAGNCQRNGVQADSDPAAVPGMDRQDYNAPHAKYRLPAPHYEKIAVPDNF
jgi:hypothetical protein